MQKEREIIYLKIFTSILLKSSDVLEKGSVLLWVLLILSFCCLEIQN